jgi:GAF domain-containing protein
MRGIGNDSVAGDRGSTASMVARYQALIRVSEALRAYHDRDTLFRSLARELRPVVRFSFLGLGLYDERSHSLDLRVLEATGNPLPAPDLSPEESLSYWIVRHQAPLVIPNVEDEVRFPKAMAYFRSQEVRSTCSLPLTTPRRRMGMLVAGDSELHVYDTEDVTFLSLVANQVALAIDDAMNYGALQQTLAVERERMRNVEACDELLRALSTVLDIRQVFPQISQIAATVLPHDLLTFAFLNGQREVVVQATSRDWAPLPTRLKVHHVIPESGGSAIIGDFEEPDACPPVEPHQFWDLVRSAGYRSMLAVHLPARDQMLSLGFWSLTNNSPTWPVRRPKPNCEQTVSKRASARCPRSSRRRPDAWSVLRRRGKRCSRRRRRSRQLTRRSCSWANPAPARKWLPGSSITPRTVPTDRSSR